MGLFYSRGLNLWSLNRVLRKSLDKESSNGRNSMALVKGCQNVCLNMEMEEQFTKGCHLGLFLDLPPTRLSANGNVGSDFFRIFQKRAPFLSLSLS